MKQKRTISVSAMISYDEAAGCYLAHCPTLNLYSAGKTEEAAERAIMGAIKLWANHYEQHGMLRTMLEKHGLLERRVQLGVNGEATHVTSRPTLAAV